VDGTGRTVISPSGGGAKDDIVDSVKGAEILRDILASRGSTLTEFPIYGEGRSALPLFDWTGVPQRHSDIGPLVGTLDDGDIRRRLMGSLGR
jgi:hypothetical protein